MNAFFNGISAFFVRANSEADGHIAHKPAADWWWRERASDADFDVYADFPGIEDALPRRAGGRPLRLLALHGRGSNNDVTQIQLTSLELHRAFAVDCLAGPVLAPPQAHVFTMLSQRGFRAWLDPAEPELEALERALRGVLAFVREHGPYDGLYGFSQGAAVVSALSAPGVAEALGGERSWRFVLCACGVWSVDVPALLARLRPEAEAPAAAPALDLPSLHVVGEVDHCRASSEALARAYAGAEVAYHPGGHELPLTLRRDEAFQQQVRAFLEAKVLEGTRVF